MESQETKNRVLIGLIEALILISPKPLSLQSLAKICECSLSDLRLIVDEMTDEYAERNGGILLQEVEGHYQFVTNVVYSAKIQSFLNIQEKKSLGQAVMETLCIVCYRQPITLAEVNEIRGVNSRGMIATLLEKKLIKADGYKEIPGKPTLYITAAKFLKTFALASLSDLPSLPEIQEWHSFHPEEHEQRGA